MIQETIIGLTNIFAGIYDWHMNLLRGVWLPNQKENFLKMNWFSSIIVHSFVIVPFENFFWINNVNTNPQNLIKETHCCELFKLINFNLRKSIKISSWSKLFLSQWNLFYFLKCFIISNLSERYLSRWGLSNITRKAITFTFLAHQLSFSNQ